MATSKPSNGTKYPTLICSQAVVHAKTFQSLANAGDFPAQGLLSLGSTFDAYEINNLSISSGKMLKECCLQEADGTLPTSLVLFPKQGILSGGKFSTPTTSVSLKTGNVSLSSVLVPTSEVPKKYFLSEKQIKKLGEIMNATKEPQSILTIASQMQQQDEGELCEKPEPYSERRGGGLFNSTSQSIQTTDYTERGG